MLEREAVHRGKQMRHVGALPRPRDERQFRVRADELVELAQRPLLVGVIVSPEGEVLALIPVGAGSNL